MTFLYLSMAGEFENYDISKNQSNPTTLAMPVVVQNSFLYNISKHNGSPTSVAFSAVVQLKQAFVSFQVLFELVISLWELHPGFRTNIKESVAQARTILFQRCRMQVVVVWR
ncbi:uncharacterized protein LOC110772333 [Prunus avium]|uniref:Uncharacterized protein LOC110772333 n=1 Tax=Prunus avium TaxID=42229 RepID=A0A6P5TXG0_PRUAV|nr:uncharacterized protein LOC110772333 [Prunus avium]